VNTTQDASYVIDGRYQIVQRIGAGAFGDVFLALDLLLASRRVAVKLLHARHLGNPSVVARFHTEAAALASIKHTNVVSVLHRGRTEDGEYLVTEFVQGPTLRQWLDAQRSLGPVPANLLRTLFDGICAGVEAAHRAPEPIVHRDLKPENVLLEQQEDHSLVPKIADFGVARLGGGRGTIEGRIVGTPHYTSPEQAAGDLTKMSPSADVFALAVMFIEMATYSPRAPSQKIWSLEVFESEHRLEHLLPALRADVPPAVWRQIAIALRRDPAQRHPNASALRRAIRDAAQSPPSIQPSPPVPTTLDGMEAPRKSATGRKSRPSRSVLVFAGMAAAVVATGAGVWRWQTSGEVSDRKPMQNEKQLLEQEPRLAMLVSRWRDLVLDGHGELPLDDVYAPGARVRRVDMQTTTQIQEYWHRGFERGRMWVDWRAARWHLEDPAGEASSDVPRSCYAPDASGPLYKVRLWVRDRWDRRGSDVPCEQLEGIYFLRARAFGDQFRICHEAWSSPEGVCASCPSAPECAPK
jgi:serine/threonine protein kinase